MPKQPAELHRVAFSPLPSILGIDQVFPHHGDNLGRYIVWDKYQIGEEREPAASRVSLAVSWQDPGPLEVIHYPTTIIICYQGFT